MSTSLRHVTVMLTLSFNDSVNLMQTRITKRRVSGKLLKEFRESYCPCSIFSSFIFTNLLPKMKKKSLVCCEVGKIKIFSKMDHIVKSMGISGVVYYII